MKENHYSLWGELLFALFFLWVGIFAYYEAMSMTSGTWYSPSIFPKLTSLLIVSLCFYEIVVTIKKLGNVKVDIRAISGLLKHALDRNVLFMILMMFLLAFMLPVIHFTSATIIFLFTCMFFYCERKNIKSSFLYLIYSVGFVIFSTVVFRTIFKVILP
ncbi:MAG: tripartite tricarboxylate transporter TctB family protein [Synergistetes bacterium]|nr:tripartite tricarboxylate transporter TctB family protein [Synergistota bacterium]MCX8127592.1 tripartite tricarboxylate transporter TctB family protein [Synergistota bacterium]MDW8191491.1 tripartite tricarboxylate transporter TctB family protein [Synergistota bacterium]